MAAAGFSSSSSSAPIIRSRRSDEVYVGAVALRAPKGPPQLLMNTAYSLNLIQHFMVIININNYQQQKLLVYDFQPQDPESIWVALAALSARKLSGVILERKLQKLPNRKCWFVGYSCWENSIDAARTFNQNWDTHLRIGHHDCRHYSQALVEYLTAHKLVLDHLISSHLISTKRKG